MVNSKTKSKPIPRALITGITGQDGSYLAELLLSKGYEIHGLVRRSSSNNLARIEHILRDRELSVRTSLHDGDLTDSGCIGRLLEKITPDEIYNLGAQSHVGMSFEAPEYTANVDALGPLRILDAIRQVGITTKFYQASTSEIFGNAAEIPQNENTVFRPASPYGMAKLFAYWALVNYRSAHNIFACNGILFNHESPRRGETFVTRKITKGIAEILAGKQNKILLGNLEAKRDWGYAPEYVEAMWLMLQQGKPDDYVVATGETHTVREFIEEAFHLARIRNWERYVGIDTKYLRPVEVPVLVGDASKARQKLGWQPRVKFKELIKIMLDADCRRMGVTLPGP